MNKEHNIEIFSVGGYSSWCYYKPFRVLFDCGEGFATHFANRIFAVDKLYLGHTHFDHTSGLIQLTASRASARGDKEKPLTIYYPESDFNKRKIQILQQLCDWNTNVHWKPFLPQQTLQLTNKHYIKAFKTNHTDESIGYIIYEQRSRLKKEYRNRNQHEIKTLVRDGVQISENYEYAVFVYALDNCGFEEKIDGCDWFVQDCNFLNNDRERPTHNTFHEAVSKANEIKAKNTILAHVSSRHFNKKISVNIPKDMFLINQKRKYYF